jgi:ribosomal protein S18 acetylase RimI-like enzyme
MVEIRVLLSSDANDVVTRIADQLSNDAAYHPLVNGFVDRDVLYETILRAHNATWVALEEGELVGHLYGAVLSDPTHPRAAWTGPDGVSFDTELALSLLVEQANASWRSAGAARHYVWVLAEESRLDFWRALGYAALSVRGVMRLADREPRPVPDGFTLRDATLEDMERILDLDGVIDVAQGDTKRQGRKDRDETRKEITSLLDDPEVRHFVVDSAQGVVAQAITFLLPSRRGSFEHTLYLSEVAVDPMVQGRGVASAMIDAILERARGDGFRYAEAQWRATNPQADSFWRAYGLVPTYVRLERTLG